MTIHYSIYDVDIWTIQNYNANFYGGFNCYNLQGEKFTYFFVIKYYIAVFKFMKLYIYKFMYFIYLISFWSFGGDSWWGGLVKIHLIKGIRDEDVDIRDWEV